jgi:hypothetical protein
MAKMDSTLSFDEAKQMLSYDPITGLIAWKERDARMFRATKSKTSGDICRWWNVRFAGKVAGATDKKGYVRLRIFGRAYQAHRVAWLLMTGEWPKNDVDHRNLIPSDNRWENLRDATESQNLANMRARRDNSCGVKGVHWVPKLGKWRSIITVMGEKFHIGYFDCIAAASLAYAVSADKHFGEFSRAA